MKTVRCPRCNLTAARYSPEFEGSEITCSSCGLKYPATGGMRDLDSLSLGLAIAAALVVALVGFAVWATFTIS